MESVYTEASLEEGEVVEHVSMATAPPSVYVFLRPGKISEGGHNHTVVLMTKEPKQTGALPPVLTSESGRESGTSANNIKATLENDSVWSRFHSVGTEMILTKQGRRMFPCCHFRLSGLEPDRKYLLVMDVMPLDSFRYRWTGEAWEPSGIGEPHVPGRVCVHPESPALGRHWMESRVSFYKVKLTNNVADQEGHVILHSMHRYLPRLHVVPIDADDGEPIPLDGPNVMMFIFPKTEFYAVTRYQNPQITQLKIDYNPFAKAFWDNSQTSHILKSKLRLALLGSQELLSPFQMLTQVTKSETRVDSKNGLTAVNKDISRKRLHSEARPQEVGQEDSSKVRRVVSSDQRGGAVTAVCVEDVDSSECNNEPCKQTLRDTPVPLETVNCSGRSLCIEPGEVISCEEHPQPGIISQPSFCTKNSSTSKCLLSDCHSEIPWSPPKVLPQKTQSSSGASPMVKPRAVISTPSPNATCNPLSTQCYMGSSPKPLRRARKPKSKCWSNSKYVRPSGVNGETAMRLTNITLQPHLDDVEGLLFVSFNTKEGLSAHAGNMESHPPPSYTQDQGVGTDAEGGAVAFVSRTGKTNDPTKIKGWRDKFSSEGSQSTPQGGIKNHSAFCSDMLDEYLESEAQHVRDRASVFSTSSVSPVAYTMPSKSSSYVRTLDSVLKSRTMQARPSPSTFSRKPCQSSASTALARSKQISRSSCNKMGRPTTVAKPVNSAGAQGSSSSVSRRSASKAMRRMADMEEEALWQGKGRTHISMQRAQVALTMLLTEQSSLRLPNFKVYQHLPSAPCLQAFCRLGCVCASLHRERRGPTHCRRPQCMFGCGCFKHKLLLTGPPRTSGSDTQRDEWRGLLMGFTIAEPEGKPRPEPPALISTLWKQRTGEHDPEPLYAPKTKLTPFTRQRAPARGPRPLPEEEEKDPVYLYFESMMTCARVREFNSHPPPQIHIFPSGSDFTHKGKNRKNVAPLKGSSRKAVSQTSTVSRNNSKKSPGEVEPTKLLEILSECNWEAHRNMVLSALCRRMNMDLLSPPFRLGFYQVRLISTRHRKKRNSCTITYKVCISRSPETDEKKLKLCKEPGLLPSLSQAIPAGILKAQKKLPGIHAQDLIQVNGKGYSHAKLLLGQMGALHPANRLAAFVTGRLQPTTQGPPKKSRVPNASRRARGQTVALASTGNNKNPEAKANQPTTSTEDPDKPKFLFITIAANKSDPVPQAADSTPPGHNMVLQPIPGSNLYHHPSGNLIQLVPIDPPPSADSGASSEGSCTPTIVTTREQSLATLSSQPPKSTPKSWPKLLPKPFLPIVPKITSFTGISGISIANGTPAVSPPGTHTFRICPPTGEGKPVALDKGSKATDQAAEFLPMMVLPGGFTLIKLPADSNALVTPMNTDASHTPSEHQPPLEQEQTGVGQEGKTVEGTNSSDGLNNPSDLMRAKKVCSGKVNKRRKNNGSQEKNAPSKITNAQANQGATLQIVSDGKKLPAETNSHRDSVRKAGNAVADLAGHGVAEHSHSGEEDWAPELEIVDKQDWPPERAKQVQGQEEEEEEDEQEAFSEDVKVRSDVAVVNAGCPFVPQLPVQSAQEDSRREAVLILKDSWMPEGSKPSWDEDAHRSISAGEEEGDTQVNVEDYTDDDDEDEEEEDMTEASDSNSVVEMRSSAEMSSDDDDIVDVETFERQKEMVTISKMKAEARRQEDQEKKAALLKLLKNNALNRGLHLQRDKKAKRRNHTEKERQRRSEMQICFASLKRALNFEADIRMSKQDLLCQAEIMIRALGARCQTLEAKKKALYKKQDVYIKKISLISGKAEEMIRNKLIDICEKQKQIEKFTHAVKMNPRRLDPEGNPLPPRLGQWKASNYIRRRRTKPSASEQSAVPHTKLAAPPLPTAPPRGDNGARGVPASSAPGKQVTSSPQPPTALLPSTKECESPGSQISGVTTEPGPTEQGAEPPQSTASLERSPSKLKPAAKPVCALPKIMVHSLGKMNAVIILKKLETVSEVDVTQSTAHGPASAKESNLPSLEATDSGKSCSEVRTEDSVCNGDIDDTEAPRRTTRALSSVHSNKENPSETTPMTKGAIPKSNSSKSMDGTKATVGPRKAKRQLVQGQGPGPTRSQTEPRQLRSYSPAHRPTRQRQAQKRRRIL